MRIIKSIQGFSSTDLLTFVTSVTAIAVISGPILKKSMQEEKVQTAVKEMRVVASDVLTRSKLGSDLKLDRGPASVNTDLPEGEVGSDPWGRAYNYRIVKNSYGQVTYILVWSRGPNGEVETPEANLASTGHVTAMVFEGDDLGVLMANKN